MALYHTIEKFNEYEVLLFFQMVRSQRHLVFDWSIWQNSTSCHVLKIKQKHQGKKIKAKAFYEYPHILPLLLLLLHNLFQLRVIIILRPSISFLTLITITRFKVFFCRSKQIYIKHALNHPLILWFYL